MSSVIVVGSGPSGLHAAATLLERGRSVTMLDVGNPRQQPPLPAADFDGLKDLLPDPARYFLGDDGQAVIYPGPDARYFVIPPSKDYVFRRPPGFEVDATNIDPAIGFSAGGLAEAWTGGCYTLTDGELADFPIGADDLHPHYEIIARRIGITAADDDLSRFSGWHDHYQQPLSPDPNSASLLAKYARSRDRLNRESRFYLGRSRVAVLSEPLGERLACDQLGRCLWGCPRNSIYGPSTTLAELSRYTGFRYVPGALVTRFDFDGGRVTGIHTHNGDGTHARFEADAYALAAGTFGSSKIVLDSIYAHGGQVHRLPGLLDNPQFLVPFVNLARLGKPVDTHAYQFHQLALGIEGATAADYIHGQITALKAASIHAIVQGLPFDLRTALAAFRFAHGALAAANVWLADRPSDRNSVTIAPVQGSDRSRLSIDCAPHDPDRFREPMRAVARALRHLGCVIPPGMAKPLPKGSSVHYAGTLPMRSSPAPLTCDRDCRSHDFGNLYFADGASFPFLPAKNLTYTLMANASRVAAAIDDSLARPPAV